MRNNPPVQPGNTARRVRPVTKTARDYALSVLERSDRTEQELRRKMQERGYDAGSIDTALLFLKEYGYVNDAEYAGKYVRACSSRKSIRQIRFDLERKGIRRDLIDSALACTEVDEECQIRAFLMKKGYGNQEEMDGAACRKLIASLSRKGFSYDSIRKVMLYFCDEIEE